MDPQETARFLSQRAARARARHDAEVDALRERVRALVRERLPAGARAWLIGSLAWGTFGPRSDVDLVFDAVPASEAVDIELAVARAANAPVDVLELSALPDDFRRRVALEGMALHDE